MPLKNDRPLLNKRMQTAFEQLQGQTEAAVKLLETLKHPQMKRLRALVFVMGGMV